MRHSRLEYRAILGEGTNIHLQNICNIIILLLIIQNSYKKILPRINNNSCARPNANTGMRQRPPRFTMS